MRILSLLLVLVLAACSSPEPTTPATPDNDLTPRQAADLAALGAPILVPADAGGFALTSVQAERLETGGAAILDYTLLYRRGAECIEVRGGNEGFGGPEFPAEARTVRIDALPGAPAVAVHRAPTDPSSEDAQTWGPGTVVSDYIEVGDIEAGGMIVIVRSADDLVDGCRPASLDDVAALTASLRVLPSAQSGTDSAPRTSAPPAPPTPPQPTDLTDLGDFAPAPTVQSDPAIQSGSTPEDASRGLADRYRGEAQSVQVQIVQSVGREATVLVTAEGLTDDSVAGERYRLMYLQNSDGEWELEDAGVQVRCHARRGHTDWSAERCG